MSAPRPSSSSSVATGPDGRRTCSRTFLSLPAPRWLAGRLARLCLGAVALAGACLAGVSETQNAVANGDTRTLSLYYVHTKESLTVTFRRNGAYDRAALKQLNWFLRDWRREEPTNMDPRLFDLLWEVYRELGSRETIHVLSAYRAPATNAMLRRRSSRVAEHSQHMLGKAIDFYLPDVPSSRVREVGIRLQRGGVGYYPSSYNPFVHLDVGSVRAWPRLTYAQLIRIFPDGKTVHIPANGRPLPGYDEARREILARGGSVPGATVYAAAEAQPKKSFWARLFGGSDESEDVAEQQAIARAPAYRPRSAKEAAATAKQVAWAKGDETSGDAGLLGFLGGGRRGQPQQAEQTPEPEEQEQPAVTADRLPPMEPQQQPQTRMAALPPPAAPPLPLARPADLAAGQTDAQAESAAPAMAIVPLPPRRPDSLSPALPAPDPDGDAGAAAAIALALAPLPPARPRDISPAAARDDADGDAPQQGAPALAFAPLPPARPASLRPALAEPVSAVAGDLRRQETPAGVLAYAATAETTSSLGPLPLPPPRPPELRGAPAAARKAAAQNAAQTVTPAGADRGAPKRPAAPARIAAAWDTAASAAPDPSDPTGAALAAALLGLKKPAASP